MSPTILLLLQRAISNVRLKEAAMQELSADDLVNVVGRAHAVVTAAKDLRTIATAIAHGLTRPRPDLGSLAAVQSVSPSGLRRRYSVEILEPLGQLAREEEVNVPQLLGTFDSLAAGDLIGISECLDDAIESTYGRVSPTELVKEEVEGRKVDDLPRLSTLLKDASWEVDSHSNGIDVNNDKALTHQLIGQALVSLSDAVPTTAFRPWTGLGGTSASIEWVAGPSIDQALAILLPMKFDGQFTHGIPSLWADRADANMAYLVWLVGETRVKLRLIRA